MPLEEDHTRNRLEDSIEVFENVTSSPGFSKKDWVVLFNKQDLVDDKVSDEFEKDCKGMTDLLSISCGEITVSRT